MHRKPAEARTELLKHVSEILMFPQDRGEDGNSKPHYVAEGTWHLVGNEEEMGSVMSPQIRSVADPRNQSSDKTKSLDQAAIGGFSVFFEGGNVRVFGVGCVNGHAVVFPCVPVVFCRMEIAVCG